MIQTGYKWLFFTKSHQNCQATGGKTPAAIRLITPVCPTRQQDKIFLIIN